MAKARKNELFWSMVYSGNGINYTELCAMDLAEFNEAVEAKILFQKAVKEARESENG